MQQLLCEPEDRLGSQSSASVSRPNSMILQSRRSNSISPHGNNVSNDGADIIKVAVIHRNSMKHVEVQGLISRRPTRFLGASTGSIFIGTPHRITPNSVTQRTRSISIQIFLQRCVHCPLNGGVSMVNECFSHWHLQMEPQLMPLETPCFGTSCTVQRSWMYAKPWPSQVLHTRVPVCSTI